MRSVTGRVTDGGLIAVCGLQALCDIDSSKSDSAFSKFIVSLIGEFSVSCSAVFSSEYGKGFGKSKNYRTQVVALRGRQAEGELMG